jgi:hypothetical protein
MRRGEERGRARTPKHAAQQKRGSSDSGVIECWCDVHHISYTTQRLFGRVVVYFSVAVRRKTFYRSIYTVIVLSNKLKKKREVASFFQFYRSK